MQTRTAGSGAVDPFRVGINFRPWSVGGGHPNRALAHGYSMHTPAGFKDRFRPGFHTPRVQPKMWDSLSREERGTAWRRVRGVPFNPNAISHR